MPPARAAPSDHSALPAAASTPGWAGVPGLLGRIQTPEFPDRVWNVADFGAAVGGEAGSALASAIDACSAAGGGRVVVPAGEWFTGPIRLESGVNLHLETGAVLRFSTRPSDYLPVVETRWEGVECLNYQPLIYAVDAERVAITGQGVLDGQASVHNWWRWKGWPEYGWVPGMPEQRDARGRLFALGEAGVPVRQRVFGEGGFLRPGFVQFLRCSDVLVEGVTLVRSPMWVVHPVLCRGVTIRGITVESLGPNNDGCDLESCREVLIEDCAFNTGDDCIALKSGRNADGRRVAVPTEDVVIRRCRMRDGHGGVVIGSEVSGGCRRVFIEDCEMSSPRLERALRVKTNSFRGGVIEDIHMRRVKVGEVSDAVVRVNYHYEEGAGGPNRPVVRNIFLEEITSARSRYGLVLAGYEDAPIGLVELRNCHLVHVAHPSVLFHASEVVMENVELTITGGLDASLLAED